MDLEKPFILLNVILPMIIQLIYLFMTLYIFHKNKMLTFSVHLEYCDDKRIAMMVTCTIVAAGKQKCSALSKIKVHNFQRKKEIEFYFKYNNMTCGEAL